jgi:hypothetical protein
MYSNSMFVANHQNHKKALKKKHTKKTTIIEINLTIIFN